MRIGIDFDNTIANYDHIWCHVAIEAGFPVPNESGKTEIRAAVRAQPDGETHWQRLQGQVYGRHMQKAQPMAGVEDFLVHSRRKGEDVFIISHKTEFGHFDKDHINLRTAALNWMGTQGFFQKDGPALVRENIYFEPTRAEKLSRIGLLNLDHFIDDLQEVLDDPTFPKGPARHLFENNWPVMFQTVFDHAA